MSECNHDCSSCASNCAERQDLKALPNEGSRVKRVIAVVSGKGGVGKTMVTSLMACAMRAKGFKVGILDADVTGPSIPKAFGVTGPATGNEHEIFPVPSATGIDIMSVNLLLEDESQPVLWRGSLISGTVLQFWTDVMWGEKDYLFVDMPPGTGDVPLTVFQSLPVDGIIVVTSPQELVSMIVEKAVRMAGMMNIPILGIVENMSYFHCPDNGKDYKVFGDSHLDEVAENYHLKVLERLPIDPAAAKACDDGRVEYLENNPFQNLESI